SQADRLRAGDVLVAATIDPGWTPLLVRAAALVTEIGGTLSHGAIVARELGLPAVLNVSQALDTLADGEQISVDGDTGIVVREHLDRGRASTMREHAQAPSASLGPPAL
ncbi:MAG: PEP-utilizing enzyme, partial [Chloroflexota bacterium]|nr:PEP-utilizing enzyme [Chloroflexota bacterium]